jgi:signal transduction histidine kinase
MFTKARIKITSQYVAIIMLVSFSFSVFLYRSISSDFQRRLNVIETRLRQSTPLGWRIQGPVHEYFLQDLHDARAGLFLMLIYANGMILLLSFAAGYYLAGKTLTPIEKAMNKQKRFIADAGHELKTPLTALQTSMEVAMRDKKLNLKEAKKVLRDGLDDIDGLNKLANDLIRMSLYQAGNSLTREKINTKNIIADVRKKINPIAKKYGVKVKYEVNGLSINANRESLEKLLTILMDNAVKYTPQKGKVTLTIKKRNRNLIIKVEDSGVGIAKKDIKRIFERFYRVDSSRSKEKVEGYGLGLSMAKQIVELHQGTIEVKSKLGKGSVFTVKLPLS